jgi:P-type E1-E2 ATPase
LLRDLKSLGLARIVLATGDRRDVAETVARALPIDAVRWELSPDQKTLVVLSERKNGLVMMIGDGINDAPALAAADLGMAMGAKGAAASPKPPTSSCWWINWIACCRQSGLRADHALSRWKASMQVWVFRSSGWSRRRSA